MLSGNVLIFFVQKLEAFQASLNPFYYDFSNETISNMQPFHLHQHLSAFCQAATGCSACLFPEELSVLRFNHHRSCWMPEQKKKRKKKDICSQIPENSSSPLMKYQFYSIFTCFSVRGDEETPPASQSSSPGSPGMAWLAGIARCSGGRSPREGSSLSPGPAAREDAGQGEAGSPGEAHLFNHIHQNPLKRLLQGE